jgi:hypothetical protein
MKVMEHSGAMQVVVVGLEPGELLLESLREVVKERDVRNGVVVSGIGTFKKCRLHYVEGTGFPSENTFITLEKPMELLSVSGVIADGEPHLHVVVSCRRDEVYAGHLEDGSEVAYLAELAILRFNELEMTRRRDGRGVSLLGPA